MNPRQLRDHVEKLNIFLAVGRARSFHAAARNLGLSQPSLSQAVKILEECLETRLLIRSQKGIELTPSGEQLFHFSERLVSEVNAVENRLRSPTEPMIGSLNIGTYTTVTTYLLPKFLVHMAEKYPRMSLGVTTLKAGELSQALISRRCHFVIGTEELLQKGIEQFPLYRDHFGFFCSPTFYKVWTKNPQLRLHAPLIFVAEAKDGHGRTLQHLLAEARIEHSNPYAVDNFESVRALVTENLGIGILPIRLANRYVRSRQFRLLQMQPLAKRFGLHQFHCGFLRQDSDEIRIKTITEELRQWCKRD